MKKKMLVQLFLILTVLIILITFFKTYFIDNTVKKVTQNGLEIINTTKLDKKNLIHKLEYTSKDIDGNTYTITSKLSEINEEKPQIIIMKKVLAIVTDQGSDPIKIYAENALYDSLNYNTKFFNNVLIEFNNQKISSDNLDLILQENFLTIFNNVVYTNLNTKLLADKIEIDLITKNSKIYMNKTQDVVKIIKK